MNSNECNFCNTRIKHNSNVWNKWKKTSVRDKNKIDFKTEKYDVASIIVWYDYTLSQYR